MDNTIQLYIDKNQEIKGYPITSPDRVIDENGVNIKQQLDTMKNITYKEVTPEMFGAKGDGVTDDTQAIKNAITALNNNGNIHLKKKYRITSSLIVPHGVGVKGLNQGLFVDNSYILADITDNSPVITFTNKSTGVSVKDIKIKAYSEANKKKFIGIDVNRAEFIKIANITTLLSWLQNVQLSAWFQTIYPRKLCSKIKLIKTGMEMYIHVWDADRFSLRL